MSDKSIKKPIRKSIDLNNVKVDVKLTTLKANPCTLNRRLVKIYANVKIKSQSWIQKSLIYEAAKKP